MKSRVVKSKTKKPARVASKKELTWDDIRKFPLVLFHTAGAPPLIGRLEKETTKGVKIWAPANLVLPSLTSVVYLPIAFVDKYIELLWAGIRGTHPIDPIIATGYESFFDQFIQNAYRMQPIGMSAGVDVPGGAASQDLPPLQTQGDPDEAPGELKDVEEGVDATGPGVPAEAPVEETTETEAPVSSN